ncbi:MAG: cytochrome P450 [Solirubrobacteraceae bacterium]
MPTAMALVGPPPLSTNPLPRLWRDVRRERTAPVPYPPGDANFSVSRTKGMLRDPLRILLDAYERHGPVFTLRVLHDKSVFMLGPQANHYMTVSHARSFSWRDGFLGDLSPLLGDGLLTIDGEFHRRSRAIMLPAFHHERIAASAATVVVEVERALDDWQIGQTVDLYAWTRELALRVAMRALFGLDPDSAGARTDVAREFERGLSYFSRDYVLQILRGPGTPFHRMRLAKAQLDRVIFAEIARRRATGQRGEDVLSLLLDARDEDGGALSDQHVRDEVMTLLFAGHDTTTSTVSFLFHELCRHPAAMAELIAEQDETLGQELGAEHLSGSALPALERAIEETLRLYPAAWIGPRRAIESFEFAGRTVPAGAPVNYCSWASHRLPDVWDEPAEFRPERWLPDARARIPKGAYVPFGGGSRTCIGMRFGQMEVKAIVTRLLQRFHPELKPGRTMTVRQMPTLSPRGGMSMVLRERVAAKRAVAGSLESKT